jgi:tetratricopeptide (TPR) repeat protein
LLLAGTSPWLLTAARHNRANLALMPLVAQRDTAALPQCTDMTSASGLLPEAGGNEQAQLRMVRIAMLQGRCSDGIELTSSAQDPEIARLRADLCLADGQYACTESALRATGVPSDWGATWLRNVGIVQSVQGEHNRAVQTLRLAQEFAPLDAPASRAYAYSLQVVGDADAGIALLRELVRQDPADPDNHAALGLALTSSASNEAIAEFQEALRLRDYSPYRYRLGMVYLGTGRIAEAREQFLLVLAGGIQTFDALNALGDAAMAEGRYNEAVEQYRRAASILPRPDVLQKERRACELASCPDQASGLTPKIWQTWLLASPALTRAVA